MAEGQEVLDSKTLDSIIPFTGIPAAQESPGQVIAHGGAMQQVKTSYTTAVVVQRPRQIATVSKNSILEARLARGSAYYRWDVKNRKTGRTSIVQGASIDLAMILLRNYGNAVIETTVEETPTHYLFTSNFVDLETGVTIPRLFRQRKSQGIGGGFDLERQEDIVFQIGQSKSQRNAILRGMPGWLVEKCIEVAQQAELSEIKPENIALARAQMIALFERYGVTIERMEAYLDSRVVDAWTPQDIVNLKGVANALKEGRVSVDAVFPKPETSKVPNQPVAMPSAIGKPELQPDPNPKSPEPQTGGNVSETTQKPATGVASPAIGESEDGTPDETEAFYKEFSNLRSGYKEWVLHNLGRLKAAPAWIQDKARAKWRRQVDANFPLDGMDKNRSQENYKPQEEALAENKEPDAGRIEKTSKIAPEVTEGPGWEKFLALESDYPDIVRSVMEGRAITNVDDLNNALNEIQAEIEFSKGGVRAAKLTDGVTATISDGSRSEVSLQGINQRRGTGAQGPSPSIDIRSIFHPIVLVYRMAAFSRARRRIPQKLKLVGRSVHRLFFVFPDGDDLFGQFVEDGQNGLQNERFDLLFDLVRDPDIVHVNIPFSVLQNGAAA